MHVKNNCACVCVRTVAWCMCVYTYFQQEQLAYSHLGLIPSHTFPGSARMYWETNSTIVGIVAALLPVLLPSLHYWHRLHKIFLLENCSYRYRCLYILTNQGHGKRFGMNHTWNCVINIIICIHSMDAWSYHIHCTCSYLFNCCFVFHPWEWWRGKFQMRYSLSKSRQ